MKQQELEIRAKENEDDKMIAQERIKLDKAKLKQKDQSEEERLRSQEDIAAMKVGAERERTKNDSRSK